MRTLVISSADTKFFGLLKDMITSLEAVAKAPGSPLPAYDLAIFDLGLSEADRAWLRQRSDLIVLPQPHLGVGTDVEPHLLAFLVRPFLPEYFPGYDIYFWIDSDVWLQSPDGPAAMLAGAASQGMGIAHERERGYRFQRWLFMWTAKHFVLGYGPARGTWLLSRPHLNAGIFAIHRDAPHWAAWARRYKEAMDRTGKLTPHDQFALNQAIHQDRLPTAILPANANWICDRGVPMWNDAEGAFCEPYAPFRRISAMHLAGPGKRTRYRIERTGGGSFEAMLRYGASPDAVQDVAA